MHQTQILPCQQVLILLEVGITWFLLWILALHGQIILVFKHIKVNGCQGLRNDAHHG